MTTEDLTNALAFAWSDIHEGAPSVMLFQAKVARRTLAGEVKRLRAELCDCQHERDRYRAVAQQTRGSVAEAEAMLDSWAADAAERGE